MPDETNGTDSSLNRRNVLKGLTVSGAAIAGVSGLSASSVAQNSEPIEAEFCGEFDEGPQEEQCDQCLPCDNPEYVEKFEDGSSDNTYTLTADQIPNNAEYITLKAGDNCFWGEVPDPTVETTWETVRDENGDPLILQDISNATLYTCDGVAPGECPPDLNIAFKYKYGTWWPDTYDDIGKEVDPDVFSIDGDRKEVRICGPFPFAVTYATRTKKHHDDWDGCDDRKDHHDHWDDCGGGNHHDKKKDHHDEWNGCGDGNHHDKKKKHHDHWDGCDDKKHHKHHDCKSCGCFKDCKEQEPVTAQPEDSDGQHCVTISAPTDGKKKGKICWFRLHCPEDQTNG